MPATPAEFALNFLWLDKNIAVAVDQVFGQVRRPPPIFHLVPPNLPVTLQGLLSTCCEDC